MKAFDADGNEIDVFSQEELDAKLKESNERAIADAIAKAEADAKATQAQDKKQDEMPDWAKQLVAKVDSFGARENQTYVERVANGLDTDKRKLVETRFESLSGYDDTPEGMARRAEDAYLLATGEKYNAGTVNMQNLAASGGGRTVTDNKTVTEADKELQVALGLSQADVDKYGKK